MATHRAITSLLRVAIKTIPCRLKKASDISAAFATRRATQRQRRLGSSAFNRL